MYRQNRTRAHYSQTRSQMTTGRLFSFRHNIIITIIVVVVVVVNDGGGGGIK